MKSLLEVLQLSEEYLKQKSIVHPRRQAQDLICDALGLNRMQLYTEHDRPLTHNELEMLRSKLARRGRGEPNAYIHGHVPFFDCHFLVTPDVLIPRQETEVLAEKIAKEIGDGKGKILWDLCTGTGCLGISLKKRFPDLEVVLSDISTKALVVAKENARVNQVDVAILEGDLFVPFKGRRTHYVVCNPPYVSEREFLLLDSEVREHEPRQALVSGTTGYEMYERLARELKDYLYPGARAWFEIGTGQGEGVKHLFQGPPWKKCQIERDWAGHDRFFFLEIE